MHFTVVVISVKVVQAVNLAPLVTKAGVALLLRMRNCFFTPVAPFRTNLVFVKQPLFLMISARLVGREEDGGARQEEGGRRKEEKAYRNNYYSSSRSKNHVCPTVHSYSFSALPGTAIVELPG